MKKIYQKPITEIDDLLMTEQCILAGSDLASSGDMTLYDGLPVRGDYHSDPDFNSNKFTSDGYW